MQQHVQYSTCVCANHPVNPFTHKDMTDQEPLSNNLATNTGPCARRSLVHCALIDLLQRMMQPMMMLLLVISLSDKEPFWKEQRKSGGGGGGGVGGGFQMLLWTL